MSHCHPRSRTNTPLFLLALALALTLLSLAGCSTPPAQTKEAGAFDRPTTTTDIRATVEAEVAATRTMERAVDATITAAVAATKTAVPTIHPTQTPVPTEPPPTPTPTTPHFSFTGGWYQDPIAEEFVSQYMSSTLAIDAPDVRMVTLDPKLGAFDQDMVLTLACIETLAGVYLSPNTADSIQSIDTAYFGIWDSVTRQYSETTELVIPNPTFTDDLSEIYIFNQSQARQIINILRTAARGLPYGQTLVAGLWDSTDDNTSDLWSHFDPAGLDQVLDYLHCFANLPNQQGNPPSNAGTHPQQDAYSCYDILRRELVLQPDANSPFRMNQVVGVIQAREDHCSPDRWYPTIPTELIQYPVHHPGTPTTITFSHPDPRATCTQTVDFKTYSIDGVNIPSSLLQPDIRSQSTSVPSPLSTRDEFNNIIVYFTSNPATPETCWLFLQRDQLWLSVPSPTYSHPPQPGQAETSLQHYADAYANGPGAIFVGDPNQLAGPAPLSANGRTVADFADFQGNVPLSAIQEHLWIYQSDYYHSLLEKANLTNPTQLTSTGENIEILHTCLNRTLPPCELIAYYWAPNLEARTNGQLRLVDTSFSELDIDGQDTLRLLADGTLSMANVPNSYIAGELPLAEILSLWGVFPDSETAFESSTMVLPSLNAAIENETQGGVVINQNWLANSGQFIFTQKPLYALQDFKGLKTRSHSPSLSEWLNGMGAEARYLTFAQVYDDLNRGTLDAAVTTATAGYNQRWYEVTSYINGPLITILPSANVMNKNLWNSIPADLQQILIEEGAKTELEQLRLASIQNLTGLQKHIDASLTYIEFSPEISAYSYNVAVLGNVIPDWLRQLDYPRSNTSAVTIFNEHVGPYVGIHISPSGKVSKTGITKGPHAGKTIEQVLAN